MTWKETEDSFAVTNYWALKPVEEGRPSAFTLTEFHTGLCLLVNSG
jgi:hypothetical protein